MRRSRRAVASYFAIAFRVDRSGGSGKSGRASEGGRGKDRDESASLAKPETSMRVSFWNWRMWAIGGAGAVAAVLILVVAGLSISYYYRERASRAQYEYPTAAQPEALQATGADSNGGGKAFSAGAGGPAENSERSSRTFSRACPDGCAHDCAQCGPDH